MTSIVGSIRADSLRNKALAEAAIEQVAEPALSADAPDGRNSIAVICWHISGNLRSRFTDFLTADGEKPWRQRDEEFEARSVTRAELLAKWEQGWTVLLETLATLRDDQLQATITIRQQPMLVHEALHRSVAHAAYHVGQIVYLAKAMRGESWRNLSTPRGGTRAYNDAPTNETATAHTGKLVTP